ncbi:hypothetical protein ACCS78_37890, partial [Rhizobium johnstonii]
MQQGSDLLVIRIPFEDLQGGAGNGARSAGLLRIRQRIQQCLPQLQRLSVPLRPDPRLYQLCR